MSENLTTPSVTPFGGTNGVSAARVILIGFSGLFLVAHLFVTAVAFTVSGNELINEPWAYYAGTIPIFYSVYCICTGCDVFSPPMLRASGIIAHLLILPCVVWSFLGIGMVAFPIMALLWVIVYRQRSGAGTPRSSIDLGGNQ